MGLNKARGVRQRQHVNGISHRYPTAWQQADAWRRQARAQWPNWCYLPRQRWASLVSEVAPNRLPPTGEYHTDVARLAALGAWRVIQGVYRFDPDVYAALMDTPLTDHLPSTLLYRLPGWCVYLETPSLHLAGQRWVGVYAHLDFDPLDGDATLCLLFDGDTDFHLVPQAIRLGEDSLSHALGALQETPAAPGHSALTSILSLVLYLCAEEADYQRPKPPKLVKDARGERHLVPPERPRYCDVGIQVGAALREARKIMTPADQIQPPWAYWQTFWTEPLDGEPTAKVMWLPEAF